MLRPLVVRLVETSSRFAWAVIAAGAILAIFCTVYSARHFSVATDVRALFPPNLPWAQRATKFVDTFPQYDILVVVNAPTPELTEAASDRLVAALSKDHAHIRAAAEPQGGHFLAQNGLLFLPKDRLSRMASHMAAARPLVQILSFDPSLRGILNALSASLMGVEKHAVALDSLSKPLNAGADTVDDVLHNRPAHFSWQTLAGGTASSASSTRFIEVAPVMDYRALQPGRPATEAIDNTVRRLGLAANYQARVRLTGLVPMNDAQFATLKQNAALNAIVSILAVLVILWLALRSWKIILAVVLNVACGMAFTAALGLAIVGSLNLISVAFFVLFVGLAVDFGIQFSVRYRAERFETGRLNSALSGAAQKAGWSLALAAAATAIGFSAFLPTDYRGLSELGEIAGPGMIIAFLTSITLLPALLRVLDPPPEPNEMAFAFLAPVDRFLRNHRYPVLWVTLSAVCLASPLLVFLHFDFNALHLQNPKSPAVATYLELKKNPATGANAVDVVAPNLAAANADVRRFEQLPQVASAHTIADFVPADQPAKLAIIHGMATTLGPSLAPPLTRPAPSDAETVAALRSTAQQLGEVSQQGGAGGRAASRLARLLTKLAQSGPAARRRVSAAMVPPLQTSLANLAEALRAQPINVAAIPTALRRDWLAPDGRARVEILPKGNPEDTQSLAAFVGAVLATNSAATGPAVLLYEAGHTIVRAFVQAGIFAVAAIALLLWIALRRVRDVVLTLVPLLLAALLTLELCVVFGVPLNFTNIIAFPLLLGVGVAFKIYYIMAWRRGGTALVQSTLTRAVLFSGLTTATAFGTLWMSDNPGTSSMGQLMALALVCTMMAAVLFQPVLMGPPRKVAAQKAGDLRRAMAPERILATVPAGRRR
jgi:hypothetical protein